MKRHVFIGVMIGIILFCTGFLTVNARTLDGNVYTTKQLYINLFYEFDQGTEFAKFLGNQGTNILDYVCNLYDTSKGITYPGDKCSGNLVSILSASEISINTSDVQGFIDRAYYIMRVSTVSNSSLYSYNDYISYEFSDSSKIYYIIFDENANFLGVTDIAKGLIKEQKTNISKDDMGRLFSHLYYSKSGVMSFQKQDGGYDKIVLAKLNNALDFYDTSNFVSNLFKNLTSWFSGKGSIVNVDTGRFDYYQKNPVASNGQFVTFLTAVMGEGISAPDGFLSIDLSSYKNGVFLEPRLDCGNDCDYRLFFYRTYEISNLYSTIFNFSEKLIMGKSYVYSARKNYDLTYVDLLGTYGIETIEGHMFLFSSNTARDMMLFYNPSSFNLKASNGMNQTLTFEYRDKTYTIKPADQEFFYNQAINANKEIDSGSSGVVNPGSFDFSVGTVTNGFKNFVSAVSGLGGSLVVFFATMPVEITSFIMGTFVMACVALVIKILL